MIRNDKDVVVERSGEFEEEFFGIDTEDVSLILEIIRNKLYSNKLGSFVREIISNAYDATVEATINRGGTKEDVKNQFIDIDFPCEKNDSTFTIRDYGTGMSEEKVKKIYTRVGKSTRSNSNQYVGMMGIGRLVGFCVTDSFNITSYLNGIRTEYLCYIDETKRGKVATLSQVETEEANGIAISINVPSSMWYDLGTEIKKFLDFVDDIQFRISNYSIDTTNTVLRSGNGWKQYARKHVNHAFVYFKMGIVKYPFLGIRDSHDLFFRSNVIVYEVPIGAITVSASRESIEMTTESTKTVNGMFTSVRDEVLKEILGSISSAPNIVEAMRLYGKNYQTINSFSGASVNYINNDENPPVTINLRDLSGTTYKFGNLEPVTTKVLDGQGNVVLDSNKMAVLETVKDKDGNIKYRQIEEKKRKDYEMRYYTLSGGRRTKSKSTFELRYHCFDTGYYKIVDDNDIEALPSIKQCRTIMPSEEVSYEKSTFVIMLTEKGAEHFKTVEGYDITKYLKPFDKVPETLIAREKKQKIGNVIKTINCTFERKALQAVCSREVHPDCSFDELDEGLYIQTRYSDYLYVVNRTYPKDPNNASNGETITKPEQHSIIEEHFYNLLKTIVNFTRTNIKVYTLNPHEFRALTKLKADNPDDYQHLTYVPDYVNTIIENNDFVEYLKNSYHNITRNTFRCYRHEVKSIIDKDFNCKSPHVTEIVGLIKKCMNAELLSTVNEEDANRLFRLHTGKNVSIDHRAVLTTKLTNMRKQFELLPEDLSDYYSMMRFFKSIAIFDEYAIAINKHREAVITDTNLNNIETPSMLISTDTNQ